MTTPPDHDAFVESLQEELRAQLMALNDCHHPVYPSSPGRLAELETRVEELRSSIEARRLLLQPGPAPSVSDIAARVGFWHFSRFAGEYARMFGELPSATLARRAASLR